MLQVSTSAKQSGVLAIIAAAASSHAAQPRSSVCVWHVSIDVGGEVGAWPHVSTSAKQPGMLAIIAAAAASHAAQPRSSVCVWHSIDVGGGVG